MGYNFPKTIKGNLFGKDRTVKWVIMYATEDREKIINCYKLFFKRDIKGLILEFEQLYFYGETEAHNQNFKPRV